MSLSISLLGPLHVTLAGEPVSFRTDAQRVLLAYLAAHQGVPVRRDALAGLLSP
ncbi:MAG: regulator, partial [Caldilineae bacterium]